jgi:hypothetical protein
MPSGTLARFGRNRPRRTGCFPPALVNNRLIADCIAASAACGFAPRGIAYRFNEVGPMRSRRDDFAWLGPQTLANRADVGGVAQPCREHPNTRGRVQPWVRYPNLDKIDEILGKQNRKGQCLAGYCDHGSPHHIYKEEIEHLVKTPRIVRAFLNQILTFG